MTDEEVSGFHLFLKKKQRLYLPCTHFRSIERQIVSFVAANVKTETETETETDKERQREREDGRERMKRKR